MPSIKPTHVNKPINRRNFLKDGAFAVLGTTLPGFVNGDSQDNGRREFAETTQKQLPQDVVSVPRGGGAIRGLNDNLNINSFTGTFRYSIQPQVSPGRQGFQPSFALEYNSSNGNGPFGLGWQLTIPEIKRKTSNGIPQYAGADTFLLSGLEELISIRSYATADSTTLDYSITMYKPRSNDDYSKIE